MNSSHLAKHCAQCGCVLLPEEITWYNGWCDRCEKAGLHNEKIPDNTDFDRAIKKLKKLRDDAIKMRLQALLLEYNEILELLNR